MGADSGEVPVKRRKIRKGTHSCWECRRRKVKCTFASPEHAICITCSERGTKCVSQIEVEGTETREGNPKHAQDMTVVEDQPVPVDSISSSTVPQDIVPDCSSSDSFLGCSTRFSTLLLPGSSVDHTTNSTHDIHTKKSPESLTSHELLPATTSAHAFVEEPTTHLKVTQALLRSLPSQKDINILLEKVTGGSMLAYQHNFKTRTSMRTGMPQEQILIANLLSPERHPVLLARQMLLFATALQYLTPNQIIPGLTEHHHVIIERLAESAIKLVTTNDELLGTLESLENIILESIYLVDCGNIRRSWMTMRRAVMVAQLLGLHRPGHYRFKVISDKNDLDPKVMWACVVSMERFVSLLLGLPTSTNGVSSGVSGLQCPSVDKGNLAYLTMNVMSKILDRNQIHEPQKARDLTREIDRELVAMTGQLPSTFWRPLALAGLEADSAQAFLETRRAWDHMCYYTLVIQLHLPYMLSPNQTSQRVYSRIACANASREILNREIAVRTFNPITACCRMGDFMAVIAGMTLMLAHIFSHCRAETDNLLIHQRLGDRATIERALECMESMWQLREDLLAAKCAALLKDLLNIEAVAARGATNSVDEEQLTGCGYDDDRSEFVIKVPYIGAIRVSRDGITLESMESQDHGSHEGVTVGGIGSIHVKSPRPPDEPAGDGPSNIAAAREGPSQPMFVPSIELHAPHVTHAASRDILASQDYMLPDAAASFDDWVFQGFDTAFFDGLMRGVGDQQEDVEGGTLGTLI